MARLLSFAVFLAIALLVLGGMHGYLWARLVRDTGLADPWRRAATVALVLSAATIPLALLLSRFTGSALARILPWYAYLWLGVAFLLFSALVAIDVVRLVGGGIALARAWLAHPEAGPPDPSRRLFLARASAETTLAVVVTATGIGIRTAGGPADIVDVPVRLPRLPPALDGLSIVQITDLHVGPTIRQREVDRVVEQANALRPDVVAITGDLVDGPVGELGAIVEGLRRLRSRYGVHFVTGNHEYYSGVEPWLAELRRLGIRVLHNEHLSVGDGGASFDLAGIDDWSAFGNGHGPDLARALAGREPDRSLVLLAHQPRLAAVAQAVEAGVELQISGHTHGGQIAPFSFLVSRAFPYLKGLYRHEEAGRAGQVFVSRGTGYWGPPMRLGAPPEIAKIVLTA
ncbi:MAG TPA: metallophosphoesterase [Anaeromyxobacteraceae bacterium]|nr:metallophosphoesterase [Anaeromyxobacteraceae bacterium]